MMAQVLGSLPPLWENGIGFLVPRFSLSQSWLVCLGSEPVNGRCISACVSTYLSSETLTKRKSRSEIWG